MLDKSLEEELIAFRRNLHEYPQKSNHEFETFIKIKKMALKYGVEESWITELPTKNGLWIDIRGTSEPKGKDYCVALRADTDALEMNEENPHLTYASKIQGVAHMCGHDGHTACLLGFIPLFIEKRSSFPCNKVARLLFQPAEESMTEDDGARLMISNGCMKGVNEVYGYHNHNLLPLGVLWCNKGPVMSQPTTIKIKIVGDGGHGSEPQKIKRYALDRAIKFYSNIQQHVKTLKEQIGDTFTLVFPVFNAGSVYNVISQQVNIEGTMRTFSQQMTDKLKERISLELQMMRDEGFDINATIESAYQLLNPEDGYQHVLRVGKQYFGEKNAGFGLLPTKASEDFGLYLNEVHSGAFFFVSGGDATHSAGNHDCHFDFNDNLIKKLAQYWFLLINDRFHSS